ncbi:hypothetical protein HRR83_002604 [Exophiala dermatitidis]|uniref:Uncharacterized protein n=2 Tax=Exophiala dermatitidis TaxID=5970 RepID=H6BZQ0_EXODN|nr:uncharacterized protein HMPREF1120_05154 [Exophiala dermatitidis NIH/UT8656]KAJ4514518.1 hypothetical protein HRR73_005546 [Exophiala dermatitidis]EHY57104.1 hypothetical protein HMPREF1120_05154 [Exophiala dermatitidis NIH/UT8656]KAJ4523714.1 hypothetical protein HRR74_001907 [Exophiala dermatitidis]KAJ4537348.1 hypothetical protein HRR76_005359 [Exophiala dermatitidis]KAJ4555054.1 hypothetical protein HRR77_000999 [Exophiala dermatitidis]
MRQCHRQKNQGVDNLWFEKRWRAHLSRHEQRNVAALSHYDDIMSTCDDLLDVPGLRKDWRLTTWHKILSMRIDEYILNYLTSMKNFWYGIVQGDSEALQKVDEATVKALELMAPGACRVDARTLHCQLDSGHIFGAFNGREREEIWVRVLDFTSDRLVPTFSSFFEDLNWFKHPIDCVRRLIHLGPRETIVSALGRMFSDLNQQAGYCVIQRSEHTFVSAPGNRANRLDWGIRQIFISAMRNYPDMAPRPKKRDLLAKPKTKEADTTGLFEFAVLAHRLGFESPEIHELMDSPPPLSASKEHVTFVDDANPDTKVKRCGTPYGKHHQKDRRLLFLENLHNASIQELGEMSSWFVRRSSYLAFFGKLARTFPLGVVTGTANSEQARETVQKEDRRQAALSAREGLEQHRTVRKTGKSRPSAPSKSYSSSLAQNFRYLELNLIRKCMRRLKRIEDLVRRCSKKWNKRTLCRARKRGMPKSNTVA